MAGYGMFPTASEFERMYGFRPENEECTSCHMAKSRHKGIEGHTFLPSGHGVRVAS